MTVQEARSGYLKMVQGDPFGPPPPRIEDFATALLDTVSMADVAGGLLMGDPWPRPAVWPWSTCNVVVERAVDRADPGLPRFTQLFLDAADVAVVRAFWVAALGYTQDRRAGVSDIYDPRRLDPVLVFQEIDASETERLQQRNRIHFELAVPSDIAQTRLATTLSAGGQLLEESKEHWRVADPEGNELVIVG